MTFTMGLRHDLDLEIPRSLVHQVGHARQHIYSHLPWQNILFRTKDMGKCVPGGQKWPWPWSMSMTLTLKPQGHLFIRSAMLDNIYIPTYLDKISCLEPEIWGKVFQGGQKWPWPWVLGMTLTLKPQCHLFIRSAMVDGIYIDTYLAKLSCLEPEKWQKGVIRGSKWRPYWIYAN